MHLVSLWGKRRCADSYIGTKGTSSRHIKKNDGITPSPSIDFERCIKCSIVGGVLPVTHTAYQITPQFLWVWNLEKAVMGDSGVGSHRGCSQSDWSWNSRSLKELESGWTSLSLHAVSGLLQVVSRLGIIWASSQHHGLRELDCLHGSLGFWC